jgi:hypothetical protein
MLPFKKKVLRIGQLPIDGPWSVAEGQHNSQIMIVRSNTGYREFGSVSSYEHQVGIAVPLREARTDGLPTPAETILLDEIEDLVCNSLEEQAESLLVAIITTAGMRSLSSTRVHQRAYSHASMKSAVESPLTNYSS